MFWMNALSGGSFLIAIRFLCLVTLLFQISGCSQQHRTPLVPVPTPELPFFTDDGDRADLLACALSHRNYLTNLPEGHHLTVANHTYPRQWLLHSVDELISILRSTPDTLEIHNRIAHDFDIFMATGRKDETIGTMLVTGYFEPLFEGSLSETEQFKYPLYSKPASLVTQTAPESQVTSVGRIDVHGNFTNYWTRAEIENNKPLKGDELVYLKDPFEAFLLHVQGSGKILLPDGNQRSVRFAGHNGHSYNSIGKLLVDEGKISLKEASIPTIRSYFNSHPAEQKRILHHNPRFIFFAWGDDKPPRGNLGHPLTKGRSIAIDQSNLPPELFGWLQTQRPLVNTDGLILKWVSTSRFVFPQDTGSAIEGPGRVDLFWGNGLYAEVAAGNMKEKGKLYFFIKKGFLRY